jgi:hypothetical protein
MQGVPSGMNFPGKGTKFGTKANPWEGDLGRPGNKYQDSLSALSYLDSSFFTDFHTFGVDWKPGEVRAVVRMPVCVCLCACV